jgi:hypothetical protein
MVWRDKFGINLLTNTHDPPPNDNFCDEQGNSIKPAITQDYNRHVKLACKGDRMAKKLLDTMMDTGIEVGDYLFTSQDLTILMSFLLLSA